MPLTTSVIHWEEVEITTLTGVWKKLILLLMDDLKGFKTSVQEVITDVDETAGEPELELEPEGVPE